MDDSTLLAIAAAARAQREGMPVQAPSLLTPFGLNSDDITDVELAQANPPPEEPAGLANDDEFPLGRKQPGNPWD